MVFVVMMPRVQARCHSPEAKSGWLKERMVLRCNVGKGHEKIEWWIIKNRQFKWDDLSNGGQIYHFPVNQTCCIIQPATAGKICYVRRWRHSLKPSNWRIRLTARMERLHYFQKADRRARCMDQGITSCFIVHKEDNSALLDQGFVSTSSKQHSKCLSLSYYLFTG